MWKDIQNFASLYTSIKALPENASFFNHRESNKWKTYPKTEFITAVHHLTLAFEAEGWRGKQIAIAIAPSIHRLLIDYALMLSGGLSVPIFTNISSKNLRFQIADADLHTVFTQTTGEYISIHYIEHLLMVSGWFNHVLIVRKNMYKGHI